jgi:hypothetical protein
MSEISYESKDVVPHVCSLVFYEYILLPFKCCCRKTVENSELGEAVRNFEKGVNKVDEGNDIWNFRKRSHTAKMF